MNRPRDNQRTAVYRWEDAVINTSGNAFYLKHVMPLPECEALIRRVFRDYKPLARPPRVKDGRGTKDAYGNSWVINLPKWARTIPVILHEIAHALDPRGAWHGPEFARLMLDLLVKYAGIDREKAMLIGITQKPRRVRFATTQRGIPQPVPAAVRRIAKNIRSMRERLRALESDYLAAMSKHAARARLVSSWPLDRRGAHRTPPP